MNRPTLLFAWLLLLTGWLSQPVHAQWNHTRLYTILDGLPYTETARCHIDRQGRLWTISTQGDLAVFDGYRFYRDEPYLQLNVNYEQSFHEDQHGLFLVGPEAIHWLNDDQWIEVATPEFITAFYVETTDEIHLLDLKGIYHTFDAEQQAFTRKGQLYLPPELEARLDQFDYFEVYETTPLTLTFNHQNRQELYFYRGLEDQSPLHLQFPKARRHLIRGPEHKQLIQLEGEKTSLHWFQNGRTSLAYGILENDQQVFFDNSTFNFYGGHYWVLHQSSNEIDENTFEIWQLDTTDAFQLYCRFQLLAPTSNLPLEFDRAGNIWIPSHSGLLKVYPAIFFLSENAPNMVGGLHVINEDVQGNIWMGSYRNGFAFFDGYSTHQPPPGAQSFQHILPGTWRDEEGFMYFFEERNYGFFKTDGRTWIGPPPSVSDTKLTGYFYLPLRNGQLAAGLSRDGLGLLDPPFVPGKEWTKIGEEKGLLLDNVLTVQEDLNGRLWCGRSSKGIAVYDPAQDTAVTWLRTQKGGLGTMCSALDSRNNLWLGTNKGLAWLEQPHLIDYLSTDIDTVIKVLDLPECGQGLVTFMKTHQNFLIFGNIKGFGLLDLPSFYQTPEQPRVYFYNTLEEYPGRSSEQNAIHIDSKGNIWMGNELGATRLAWDKLVLDTTEADFNFSTIITGKGEQLQFDSFSTVILPRGDRNVTFSHQFENNQTLLANTWVSYALLINGQQADTLTSAQFIRNEPIRFGYLPPGKHQLVVTLQKNNRMQHTQTYRVIVPKFLEENWWFWVLVPLIILTPIGIVTYLRYQNYKQKQKHKLEKVQLLREKEQFQIQAIVSSLNPHFINNTLHWLQAKVFDDKTAVKVIDRLASNIRILFQRSRKNEPFHTLTEEMDLVENYLLIQENRFGSRYRYIPPDPTIIARFEDLKVPLMQIQIHVENAIEHGLRNREGSTYVKVVIREEREHLTIVIEDDGVGYSRSKAMKSRGTQQGTKMLKSLHKIFNTKNHHQISTEIEENIYIDSNSLGYGTRISVSIPKEYTYELEHH